MIRTLANFIAEIRMARAIDVRYAKLTPGYRPMPLLTRVFVTWYHWMK